MSPSYEFLSAPAWLITGLHVLTLALHFAAMGLLFGGLGTLLLARAEGKWENPALRGMLRALPTAMAATVTLGVAPLLFLQLVYHRQVYSAAIVSAWWWLGILVAAVVAYFALYRVALAPRPATGLLAVALVALAYVSFAYSGIFALAEAPATIAATYAAHSGGTAFNPDVSAWLPRWLHMLAGAFTLGAFWLAVFTRRDERLAAFARRALVVSFAAAAVLGLVYLGTLGPVMVPLLGGGALVWIPLALVLTGLAVWLVFRGRLVPAGALLFVSLLAMVVNRHQLRALRLDGVVDAAAMPFHPQWSVLALFAVCFVLALAAVFWMVRKAAGEGIATG